MKRSRGFTLIEILIVIAIIGILAGMLVPSLVTSRCTTAEAASKAAIQSMATALSMYNSNYAAYPKDAPNYSSKPLVEALTKFTDAMKVPYYDFKKGEVNEAGEWVSKLGCVYYYRNNHQHMYENPGQPQGFNKYEYDIWSADCTIMKKLQKRQGKGGTKSGGDVCHGGGDPLSITNTTRVKNW